MNNFFTLLKYSLLDSFKLNKLKKKKSGIKLEYVVALVYLLIFTFVTLYMFIFVDMFNSANAPDFIFLFAIVLSAFLTFLSTITKANVYIFKTKDYENLMSLPIKPSVIVAVKIMNLYLLNFIFVFTILGAVVISYFFVCGFDIAILLTSILVIIFLPLFPIVASSFIAFLLGFIPLSQKTRNIFSTILYLIFMIVFFVFYFKMMNISDDEFTGSITSLYQTLGNFYFLGNWAFKAIVEKDIIMLLLFILVSIGSFALFVFIVGRFFKTFNGLLSGQRIKSNYSINKEKFKSSKGEVSTLFKKELRMYLGFPSYIMNTIVGPLMAIIAVVMFALQYDNLKVTIEYLFKEMDVVVDHNIFILLIALVNVLFVSLVTTTASSISLEGKSFWILKSAPIKTTSIFYSKILVNLLINIPVIIISMIVAGVIVKGNILLLIGATLIPIIYATAGAFLGLYFNILKPNFNYDNPIKPVKQDLPVLFSMLISFGITLISFGILFGLLKILNISLILVIEILLSLIVLLIATVLLFKDGVNKFNSLQG